jgi:hypothetical protein
MFKKMHVPCSGPNEKKLLEIIRKSSLNAIKRVARKNITPATKALMDKALLVEKTPREAVEENWPLGIGA